jgi:hypothetical protein
LPTFFFFWLGTNSLPILLLLAEYKELAMFFSSRYTDNLLIFFSFLLGTISLPVLFSFLLSTNSLPILFSSKKVPCKFSFLVAKNK